MAGDDDKLKTEGQEIVRREKHKMMSEYGINHIHIFDAAEMAKAIEADVKQMVKFGNGAALGITSAEQERAFIIAAKERFGVARMGKDDRIAYIRYDEGTVMVKGKLDKNRELIVSDILIPRLELHPASEGQAILMTPFSGIPQGVERIHFPVVTTERGKDAVGAAVILNNPDETQVLNSALKTTVGRIKEDEQKAKQKSAGTGVAFNAGGFSHGLPLVMEVLAHTV